MKQYWNISNTMVPIFTGIGTGSIDAEVKWNDTEIYQLDDANCYRYQYHRHGSQMKWYWNISTQCCQLLPVSVPGASTRKSNEMMLKHIKHNGTNCYRYWYRKHRHRSQMKEYWNISTQWCQLLLVLIPVASTQKLNETILKCINTMLPIVTGIGTGSIDMEVKWNDTETY
jgi:hypothetical protein